MAKNVKLIWKSKKVLTDLNRHISRTMQRITLFLEKEIKRLISRGNRDGRTPSRDGEPPKVRTGALRASIVQQVTTEKSDVVGIVGTRRGVVSKYAKVLEEGNLRDGTKRPYLRPTLMKHRVTILKMLR